jgi:hypothetical protein
MSKIHAYDDLRDNHWDVIEENISSNYADLHIGFTNEKPVVEFDNLKFGFELTKDGAVIDSHQWPPDNVKYRRTDQKYLVAHRLKFQPDQTYDLFMWAENAGIRAEKTHTFTAPRPAQPYASWTWDETYNHWRPPVDIPADGGDYMWDEDAGDWVVFEMDGEE